MGLAVLLALRGFGGFSLYFMVESYLGFEVT